MVEIQQYPKRLIEVDLPIRRISEHARREKSIRHGHISTLHIWWARRPLAACRAVLCAALWPDPADPRCPYGFVEEAGRILSIWANDNAAKVSPESFPRLIRIKKEPSRLGDRLELREALLDFIADFANWDNSTDREYLKVARALTHASHTALGGTSGTRPVVVDPFAGGGSIPLEAVRIGADTVASDLNPVPVLLNKLLLEKVPKHGNKIADEVRKAGREINLKAARALAELYPRDSDGSTPIAYLWARTVRCEGPDCGAEIPLVRSFLLGKRNGSATGVLPEVSRSKRTISYKLAQGKSPELFQRGTLRRGSATCLVCGYTTSGERVRKQAAEKNGGADGARLLAVYCDSPKGRFYREPTERDLRATVTARALVQAEKLNQFSDGVPIVPDEELPYLRSIFNIHLIGVHFWAQMFSSRQLIALITLAKLVRALAEEAKASGDDLKAAVATALAMAMDRQADYSSSICTWVQTGEFVGHTFAQGQSLPIKWDFAEVVPFATGSGNWDGAVEWVARVLEETAAAGSEPGIAQLASAIAQPLPDDAANAVITDPPYYDAVPYADLADFFYVWLKRTVGPLYPELFHQRATPKDGEIVQLAERNPNYSFKTREYFESRMADALRDSRRVTAPSGLAVIVFAHKDTSAWETMLQAVIAAGWTVVASWPIDTERQGRLRAMDSAALTSSVHLVCRPRENGDGSLGEGDIGDWRQILSELPRRIHEWMPRLAQEGIVGADAIFACLGPALEVFSRYSRVEKANGDVVGLNEYLEQVWAAVSREALRLVMTEADTVGLEADGRLTAIWLWTVGGGKGATAVGGNSDAEDEVSEAGDGSDDAEKLGDSGGFILPYDAARKIAQGLGARLEELTHIVEVNGKVARLFPVAERAPVLFGNVEHAATGKRVAKKKQMALFAELDQLFESHGWGEIGAPKAAMTTLDRVHQAMLLFGSGRGEALKRFLIEEGVGKQAQFWKLAQSLSALYPSGSDEKRWVDGVLARKKGLGFG